MAKEGTVAPKERVNIVYRPALGDAKEEVELPLKVLVMGDFTGAADERPLEKREPTNIDKDNFDEVLKSQGVGLKLTVPNQLSGKEGDEMGVKVIAIDRATGKVRLSRRETLGKTPDVIHNFRAQNPS